MLQEYLYYLLKESIRDVSESGLVMPQKSTYFYPKLATGLLFNASPYRLSMTKVGTGSPV